MAPKEQSLSSSTSSESDSPTPTRSIAKSKTPSRSMAGQQQQQQQSVQQPQQTVGRKLKKLPDKKLKTSDGRHGPEFQPPSTERNESTRAATAVSAKEHSKKAQADVKKTDQAVEGATTGITKKPQSQLQHHREHRQRSPDTNVLRGPRDNDGPRSTAGPKSSKKPSQPVKHSQQSTGLNIIFFLRLYKLGFV